jgi:hypothetical protein
VSYEVGNKLLCRGIDLREIGWDGIDEIDLAQERDQWRALVNTVLLCQRKYLSALITKLFSKLLCDVPLMIGEKRMIHGWKCSITFHLDRSRNTGQHISCRGEPAMYHPCSPDLNSFVSVCQALKFWKENKVCNSNWISFRFHVHEICYCLMCGTHIFVARFTFYRA